MSSSCAGVSSLRSSRSFPAALDALKALDNLALKSRHVIDDRRLPVVGTPFALFLSIRGFSHFAVAADHSRRHLRLSLRVRGGERAVLHALFHLVEVPHDDLVHALGDRQVGTLAREVS